MHVCVHACMRACARVCVCEYIHHAHTQHKSKYQVMFLMQNTIHVWDGALNGFTTLTYVGAHNRRTTMVELVDAIETVFTKVLPK